MTHSAHACCAMMLAGLPMFAPSAVRADDGLAFFESEIRPLLVECCIECHGGAEPEGGLSLDSRRGWQDESVIEPGNPNESLLITATILHLMGIDHKKLTYFHGGLEQKLTGVVEANVIRGVIT